MGDLRKRLIFVKCWFLEEKTRDFRLNGGFSKRKRVFFCVKWGILEEKTRDFRLNEGFEKTCDFHLNVGFSKRTRDLRINV